MSAYCSQTHADNPKAAVKCPRCCVTACHFCEEIIDSGDYYSMQDDHGVNRIACQGCCDDGEPVY